MSYSKIIAALDKELRRRYADIDLQASPHSGDVVREMLERQAAMPDYLRLPMRLLTWGFDYWGLLTHRTRFRNQPAEQQADQFDAWKNSRIDTGRNFIRFYESLYLLIVMQEDKQ